MLFLNRVKRHKERVSYVTAAAIEELHKGAKLPQCNSDFTIKIEVRYNIG